ncbi:PEP-utilizing enzyme [Bradyrhizobium sp. PMVTL-01]|uniref:PEP-utilizing enzyme n=1 Tax=Bradyrhizobium sp. PMVTL-01 TaxID=3434999 RepID=UPI003F7046AC
MSITEACFKVEGRFMTEIARTRVIEGRYDHGYRILHDGLHGISSDQVISILNGDCKLIGVNEVELVEDGDVEWKKRLLEMFGGTWVTSSGRFMRPYAVVTSWGPDDMSSGDRITKDSDSIKGKRDRQEHAGSSLYYADDPQRDVLKVLRTDLKSIVDDWDLAPDKHGRYHFLFQEVRNYPFQLVPAHSEAQAALDQYVAVGRRLKRVGYAERFPAERYRVRYETNDPTEPRPAVESHFNHATEIAQRDAREIGRHRAKMIDAEKAGRTVEDMDAMQAIMRDGGQSLKKRIDAFHEALALQREMPSRIPAWRAQIIQQAGDDWISITVNDKEIKLPRAPFENWCLWRTDGAHLAMPWQQVSPQGVKMFGDDPYHTDFLIGAGLEPDAMIADGDLNEAIYNLRHRVQEEKLGFKCAVLSGNGTARGTVVHPKPHDNVPDDAIVVLRDASPAYLDLALKAKAVIVERGGSMAHLVTVARAREAIIVRVDKALKLYPVYSSVTVDASAGTVQLHEGNMKSIWEISRPEE